MNDTFQTIIIASLLILALAYVFRKQLWKSKKKNNGCGNDGCGC
ncbi:MAG: FeoB-associated Cys-rich membrane protein [Flavobacteriaceae bacterium]|nr:FeoB-associated Cys-rich membrane protein [Flavobacteriaceae bacterium]